jgi:DNA-binding LytR/AlgR family response regulator
MYVIEQRSFTWTTFLTSFWQVTALGVIISALIVPLDYLRHYKANQKEAEQVPKLSDSQSTYNNIFKFESENQKEQLRLSSDELLYLTSADNYVEVVFSEGPEVSKKLLRGTLARAEEQIHDPNIIRCHRSYIVNLHKVISVSGNAQGFQLTLRGTDRIIPVSTTYKKEVMRLLKG